MTFALAGDILYIILEILGDQSDYNSLYQCAITSRCFTEPALQVLYRRRNSSPLSWGKFISRRTCMSLAGTDDVAEAAIRKWAAMWRSITLSTLEHTYLPYYSYIRYLDLEGLRELHRDLYVSGDKGLFFTPEIDGHLAHEYAMRGTRRLRSSSMSIDENHAVLTIGWAIIKKSTSIRGVYCRMQPSELAKFLQQLPSLQTLRVWSGDFPMGDKIRNHCPNLKQLTIESWGFKDADSEKFLNELQPNTLESFDLICYSGLGPRMIRGLGSHWNSLTELKLGYLGITATEKLLSLTAPPALKVLVLTTSIGVRSNEASSQMMPRVAKWIRSCKALQRLELRRFMDDALLLAQILPETSLRLSSLSLADYRIRNANLFHEALHHQQSLEHLDLNGRGSDQPEHNEPLFQAISKLNNLRELDLYGVADGFTADDVMALTPFLPHLEKLLTGGKYFRDDVWNAFLRLPKLKNLMILGRSEFSAKGILDFINQLGPGNSGFSLSILDPTSDTDIDDTTAHYIRMF
ncbi:hypothetical protein BDV33DRAFT_189830 [Aspergillus novoparasiticus]|uniref:F-box domain-containing protein n=1 Tax=Aspergillus novoparasiticus TaxID=986946 RepID=A0A5N6EX99_9EURO|nr:hypothetical protein BDV33DRAFT_189830 [Aspergillus novoparasiticus]